MTAEIIGVEADVADGHLGLMRVQRRVSLGETILLQHVEHSGLACVVEAQKHDISTLLEEAHPFHGSFEEVHDEHSFSFI